MRILLLGEYSRLHYTLAEGLRSLGHEVRVASDGDGFKDYPRDVDICRKSSGLWDTLLGLNALRKTFTQLTDYDIVQIINPCFTPYNVRINKYLFNKLKKNNKKIFLGAFGDDSYWVKACLGNTVFKYSEFFVDGKPSGLRYAEVLKKKWIDSPREKVNKYIAQQVDGIVACLYEYYKSYESDYTTKLHYIPLPVNTSAITYSPLNDIPLRVNFFIGINRDRSEYKGTDIMEKALLRLQSQYPDRVNIIKAESLNYETYKRKMDDAHVVLDQLYSYSPAMNALLAMAKAKVVVGGGEPEIYDLMGELNNRPIVNVYPSEEDVYKKLEGLLLDRKKLVDMSLHGRLFVEKHHDYIAVAKEYLQFWMKK